jgi:tetrapyrrole methylase family protein/MazG family protein
MARQAGPFSIQDVYEHVTTKLIRRHPHVFGDLAVGGSGDVLRNWDAIKQAERASQGRTPRGTLDGIPRELPALAQAQELAGKAAKTGFEWRQAEDIWAKIFEEIGEVQAVAGAHDLNSTERQAQLARELGDLLLATAVLARHLGVDAESALRSASSRFRSRFERIEQLASDERRTLRDLTLDEMLALWARAKRVVGG